MRNILLILPDEGLLFDAAGIADILGHANQIMTETVRRRGGYRFTVATTRSHRVVRDRVGLHLLADHRLVDLDPMERRDTIFVTSMGADDLERKAVADWLQSAAPRARRVASVCAGALLLAQTGLLDGRRATTHWRRLDQLQAAHPAIQVERGPIFVQDGPYWTSAGVTAAFDMTLALIEEDHGAELARAVAQDLVMYLRRPGSQSQFSRLLDSQAPRRGAVGELQAWIHQNLQGDLSLERLAERAAMSPRHLARTFLRETGKTPAKYVEEIRLEAARNLLEQGSDGLDEIAVEVGLTNALGLRRVFERVLEVTPSEYRERFRSRTVA